MKAKKTRVWVRRVLFVLFGALLFVVGLNFGAISARLSALAEKMRNSISPVLVVTLLAKCGIVSVLAGLVTRCFQSRKERFLNGEVECRLQKDYALIVGYDFQVKPLIKMLLCSDENLTVLLMTDCDVRCIRLEMATELTKEEIKRLMIMRRNLAIDRSYQSVRVRGAKSIYLMGDEGRPGRDGTLLRTSDALARKAASEPKLETDSAVKVYMQLDDPTVYSQMRSRQLAMDQVDGDAPVFDLELFNYYDSWVWKCWSQKGSADGSEPYLPLKFKADAPRVELFVIGDGKALKAFVDSAITLLNYGNDARNCKLTVVSDRVVLPLDDVASALPELELSAYPLRDLQRTVFPAMIDASSRNDTSVTVAIAEDEPDETLRRYLELPFALRSRDVSALLWTNAQSRNLPEKRLVKVDGDNARLRYLGMPDCLPWYGSGRYETGADVNYYYSVHEKLPKGTDTEILAAAKSLWNGEKAVKEWMKVPRWKKWSSVNSADSYKEKVALIGGREVTPDILLQLLKAEHDRWWTERLLANWRAGARDNARRLHPNLVPFDELDDFTKDIDKICIASMVRQGFISTAEAAETRLVEEHRG